MEKRKRAMSADNLSTVPKRLAAERETCRTPPSPPASPEVSISLSAASSPTSRPGSRSRSRSSGTSSPALPDAVVLAGFETCAREAIRFLIEQECLGPTHPIVQQLQQHLEHQKQLLLAHQHSHQPSSSMPPRTSSAAATTSATIAASSEEDPPPQAGPDTQ